MSWPKFIYISKNSLSTWQNFTCYQILKETDLSQFHAATTLYVENADQDLNKHFQGDGLEQKVQK
jgi:hypothetical protein